jgi:hypothetical protein
MPLLRHEATSSGWSRLNQRRVPIVDVVGEFAAARSRSWGLFRDPNGGVLEH